MTSALLLAAPLPREKEYTNSIGMRLVRIEPGNFIMGFAGNPLPAKVAGQTWRANGDFDERPGLVRAMIVSQLGRRARGYRRRERLEAIARALRDELPGLSEPELRRAEAVLAYLHNMLAYTTLREEQQFSGAETGEAIGWAIRTLVADLRRRQRAKERKR